jgi:histidyl-tRNA synthetase
MKTDRCKGMRDLLPEDMAKFRRVEEVFRRCSSRSGYEEVRTPTLEYLHLFTAVGTLTPAMLGRVYSFLDWDGWSGERVVLRPEGTIPAARLYAENLTEVKTCRLSYVGNIFTFEETGKESREQWQCGVELIGPSQPSADAEIVMLAVEVLNELGLGRPEVRLSHAGLIKALIGELGVDATEQTHIFDQVLEGNIKALGEVDTVNAELKKAISFLLDVKGNSPGFIQNIRALLGDSLAGLELSLNDLTQIAEHLDAVQCPYQIDVASGRGFEYYTGAMFQFHIGGKRIGGGGRYDDLISLVGGPHVPASGFALFIGQIMDLLKVGEPTPPTIMVRVEESSASCLKTCSTIARSLREAGYEAILDHGEAESGDCQWVVTVLGKDRFRLVDQPTGRERELKSATKLLEALEGSG